MWGLRYEIERMSKPTNRQSHSVSYKRIPLFPVCLLYCIYEDFFDTILYLGIPFYFLKRFGAPKDMVMQNIDISNSHT
jgi:hypothetical protein